MEDQSQFWKKCSSCRKPIGFKTTYWVCNVSTCNRKRTGLVFCTVACWDAHVPMERHKDPWALEQKSPSRDEWERIRKEEEADLNTEQDRPTQKQAQNFSSQPKKEHEKMSETEKNSSEAAVLVVVSKVKNYIKDKSGMNTSGTVMDVLSDRVRTLCDQAIENAKSDGRKTVMDRDF